MILYKKNIKLFVYLFMLIFGPKFGLLDCSIVTSLVIIIMASLKRKLVFSKEIISLLAVIIFLSVYILIMVSVNGTELDIVFLGKFIRVFFAILSINILINDKKYSKQQIVEQLINILILHSIIVIISALFYPNLQVDIRWFTGVKEDLVISRFRSAGLVTGYDFSGFLCMIGLILVGNQPRSIRQRKILKMIIFMVAALLTSRFTMLFLEIILFYFIFKNKELKVRYRITLLSFLAITFIPVIGIFLYSTGNKNNPIISFLMEQPFFANILNNLVYYYASSDLGESFSQQFYFGTLSDKQLLWGAMENVKADPGYTQFIYKIGIIGLIIVMIFYLQILKNIFFSKTSDQFAKYIRQCLLIIIIAILALSMKNSYLLARNVTEIILILYFLFMRYRGERYL